MIEQAVCITTDYRLLRASCDNHEHVPFNRRATPLSCFLFERLGLFSSGNGQRRWKLRHEQYHLFADQRTRTVSTYSMLGLFIEAVTAGYPCFARFYLTRVQHRSESPTVTLHNSLLLYLCYVFRALINSLVC